MAAGRPTGLPHGARTTACRASGGPGQPEPTRRPTHQRGNLGSCGACRSGGRGGADRRRGDRWHGGDGRGDPGRGDRWHGGDGRGDPGRGHRGRGSHRRAHGGHRHRRHRQPWRARARGVLREHRRRPGQWRRHEHPERRRCHPYHHTLSGPHGGCNARSSSNLRIPANTARKGGTRRTARFSGPKPPRPRRRSAPAWRARRRSRACCPPRSRRSRTAERGRAGRRRRSGRPPGSGA